MRRPNPDKANLAGSPYLKKRRCMVDSAGKALGAYPPEFCGVAVELFRIVDLG